MPNRDSVQYAELFRDGYHRDEAILYSACYLCGTSSSQLEEEHVIPRVLFRSINPGRYIKLKACSSCNRPKGEDDEYVVRLLQGTSFNEHAERGIDNAFRGMRNGHGVGLYADQMARSRPAATVRVGNARQSSSQIAVPMERINRFQTTIAKGLWTTLQNHIFNWDDYDFKALYWQTGFENGPLSEEMLTSLQNDARYSQSWDGVFKYSGDFTDNEVSYWVLTYYDVHVSVVVVKRNDIDWHIDLHDYIFGQD